MFRSPLSLVNAPEKPKRGQSKSTTSSHQSCYNTHTTSLHHDFYCLSWMNLGMFRLMDGFLSDHGYRSKNHQDRKEEQNKISFVRFQEPMLKNRSGIIGTKMWRMKYTTTIEGKPNNNAVRKCTSSFPCIIRCSYCTCYTNYKQRVGGGRYCSDSCTIYQHRYCENWTATANQSRDSIRSEQREYTLK